MPTLVHDSPTGGGQKPMVLPRVTPAVTAKWAKGTGGPAGDEAQNLVPVLNDQGGSQLDVSHGVAGTLRAQANGNHPIVAAPVAFKVRGGKEGGGKGYLGSEDKALTLSTVQEQFLAEPIGFDHAAGAAHGMSERLNGAPTLQASSGIGRAALAHPVLVGNAGANGAGVGSETDPSYTLDTTGQQAVAFAFAENSRNEIRLEGGDGTITGALSTGGGKPGQGTPTIATPYAVRRLTPTECERLQGFPDGHTALAADDREIADTHRYRMLGNAVTVNVAEWIGKRLYAILTGAAE